MLGATDILPTIEPQGVRSSTSLTRQIESYSRLGVDPQDLLPSLEIRETKLDLPVKSTGTQQGRVKGIGPIESDGKVRSVIRSDPSSKVF